MPLAIWCIHCKKWYTDRDVWSSGQCPDCGKRFVCDPVEVPDEDDKEYIWQPEEDEECSLSI